MLCSMEVTTSDDIPVVRLHGDVDSSACPNLERVLLSAAASARGRVVLDLLGVRYVESAPIGTLVKVDRILDARGGGLAIASGNDDLNKLFATAGLHDFMHVFGDLESATAFFSADSPTDSSASVS